MNFVTEGKKYLEKITKENQELDKRIEALKKFKEKSGLKGKELKEAFEKVYNSGISEPILSTPKLRELTKSELDEIKVLEKKDKENDEKFNEFKKSKTVDGKKIPPSKQNQYSNDFMNKGQMIRKQINDIKRKPQDDYNIQKIKDAYKRKEFDKETRDELIRGVELGGSDELDLYYKNKGLPTEHEYKKTTKEKKTYKEGNIMKARSDLKKKGDKYTVDTEMNVREGLDGKTKRALKKSIEEEVKKKIKGFKKPVGFGVEKIVLDYSSNEDEEPKKKRGRPKKGKGIEESESSSDEEDIKTYGQMLKHLVSHIKDPKEPIDPKDYKQAMMLIKKIKSKKD